MISLAMGSSSFSDSPLGPKIFVKHTQRVLSLVGQMQDKQAALHIVRRRLSFRKLGYSMRTVPPALQHEALGGFSQIIWKTLREIIRHKAFSDRPWTQSQLRLKSAGLGLRCAQEHSAAAFIASTDSVGALAVQVDPHFDLGDPHNHLRLNDAKHRCLGENKPIQTIRFPQRQDETSYFILV